MVWQKKKQVRNELNEQTQRKRKMNNNNTQNMIMRVYRVMNDIIILKDN